LDADGLREAIQKPAHTARVFIEPALVERLVADAADQPGALPMVQETMVLLWERKRDRYISLDAYESLGDGKQTGLQAAMAYRADRALAMLTPRQRAIVFRILIRLVQFGEGRADTRRQQPVVALISADDARAEFDETLDRLIATRLIALNYVQARAVVMADLAHEALITGWSALDQWIKDHRDAELKRRRLDARAQEWIRLGRARAGLLDATETREARAWLASAHAQDLGGSDDLLALIKQSSRGFNPGFQPRGVGLLLVGFVELVALLGGVILFIQSSNATSSSQVAFWFTVVIILVLGTAMLTLTLRGERFLLQRLSYFLTRERRAPIALVGSFVVVAAIWGGLGVTLIAHERECNRRGFVRDARPHVAVIAPSIEPAYLQTFRRTFADASENFLTPERVTAEDWMQCSNFFSYRINLNRADGAVGEIVYVAELTFLKSGDTRPEIASDPGGGCNLIFALAHRVARRLDQDLDPNSDENPIPPGRLPNQCEPYERDAEGVRLLNDRLFADAENQFKQAIALAPEFTSPYVGLAQVYYQTNRASDAIAQLNRAISLAPSFYWRAENQLAIACYYSSDYKCAIDRYLKAIEVNNRNLEAYNNLAVVYLDAGQLDQAEIMLKRAEALVAQTRSRREAGLRYNVTKTRGILEFKLGKWSEAIRVLQIADQMQPKEFQELIVYYLALANANVSNPTQACTYLRRYEQIVPSGLVGEAERRADSLKRLAECR
jgi:tetratricopeptide (TPR) repeat protein